MQICFRIYLHSVQKMISVSKHYDLLIENNNDPIKDSLELQNYMNRWDGDFFIRQLCLDETKSILEIGCGTGRILNKILGAFKSYTGIDVSCKTVERAKEHFSQQNVSFITGDFINYKFNECYDVIYSTLTFMHIKDKKRALQKVYSLLNVGGKFVLSIDKNRNRVIDTGYSKIKVFPDKSKKIVKILSKIGFINIAVSEIDFAYVITASRN